MPTTPYLPIVLTIGVIAMLLFFVVLAIREAKNTNSLHRFYLFGDDFKPPMFGATLIASNAGLSGAFVLILYYGYLYGLAAFPFVWAFWLLTQIASAATIRRVEAISKSRKSESFFRQSGTLHEFIADSFGSNQIRAYCGVLSCGAYIGLVACELVLASHILDFVFPKEPTIPFTTLPMRPFAFIVVVMLSIMVYNVLAGFRGVVQTDFAQWIIMSAMLVVICAFVFYRLGDISAKYSEVYSAPKDGLLQFMMNPDKQGVSAYMSFIASNLVFWGLWWPGAMDQWQRCAATHDIDSSLNKIWGTIGVIPTVYFAVLSFAFLGLGAWIRLSVPDTTLSPDLLKIAVGEVLHFGNETQWTLVGTLFCAVTLWGLICASMSTIDTYVISASHSLAVDVCLSQKGTLREQSQSDTDGRSLKLARGITAIIPIGILIVATLFGMASDVYSFIYFSFSLMFAILPSLAVALSGRASQNNIVAAERSLVAGGVFAVSGYCFLLLPLLEYGLRNNHATTVFWSYQGIYWWPFLTSVVGSLVFGAYWLRDPNSFRVSIKGN